MEPKDFIGLSGVPIVIGLTSLTKPYISDKRAWPVVSMVYAIVWSLVLAVILKADLATAAAMGVVTGLAASGLYSGVKNIHD